MASALDRQAEELYRSFMQLVRQYQFRDREEICCRGISVSQCYALAFLRDEGAATMSGVAGALHLDLSTITRLADQLEEKGLVKRARAKEDRRVTRLSLTRRGQTLLETIEGDLVAEYRAVLQGIPASSRKSVLDAIDGLGRAFAARRSVTES